MKTILSPERATDFEHNEYMAGPTACVAHPKVVRDIRRQISQQRVLSTADARLATLAGMMDVPAVGKTGFNDGVIYPPAPEPKTTKAGLVLAAKKASKKSPSALFSMAPPSTKTVLNCLVLLVDFSDNPGTQTSAHFDNLLFDKTNANSMTRFYDELSFGRLDVQGTVTNWIRASKPYSYYADGQSGTGSSFPKNTPGLLKEILTKYCASKSLKPFDVNGDGYVDGLFLVHAGGGAEAEPNVTKRKSMIWSHKWTLPSPFTNNGVRAFAYFTAPEDGRLGVFSHEFGHFLGLPDLYDTSYRSHGIGDWCLMAAGSWNGQGNKPARLSAWCLSALGWVKPTNLNSGVSTLTLGAIETDKTACYRLWAGGATSKEYFLIENRQKAGRDAGLPGSGLAVWHVDERQGDNTNPLAYRVGLVQADGRRDLELNKNEGDAGDVFPGSRGVTKVDDGGGTHPHLRKNDGTASGVALSAISTSGGVVKLKAKV
jgi:immune inhibitor A